MWEKMSNTFYLKETKVILATRELADFVIQLAEERSTDFLSLKDIDSASRSFLDELYILTAKNKMKIIDIPQNIMPLFDVIKKSHQDQIMYAPKLKVRISTKTFA